MGDNNSVKEGKHHLTLGQRAADKLALRVGSWIFIFIFIFFIAAWIILNVYILVNQNKVFDQYPFIFLNLVIAFLTAIQVPIILMSQNRAEERDRIRAEYDYAVNRKAEKEIRAIQEDLKIIKNNSKIKN
mgnify:FL=1